MDRIVLALLLIVTSQCVEAASNFPDRKALIVQVCPYVELTSFSYANEDRDRSTRFVQRYNWINKSQQSIVAFEIVTLKYDAFDQRMFGSRTVVTGTDSANWTPLPAGAGSSDGTIGYGSEDVFTAIAYVRRVRLADGTVWSVNDLRLRDELKKVAPGIREFGNVAPDPKKEGDTKR